MDAFGRTVDYLRISVTDRCNERCLYCMPEGYKGWEHQSELLRADEIVRVVRAAVGLGFRKFRLTGGEPLVRCDVLEIARGIATIPGVECIGVSTNGTRLASLARSLRTAGLRTVNVSLDALDSKVYRRITGGHVESVLAGIRAAIAARFERVKLNCVLLRGMNEQEIWPLILFAAEHGLPLRFIEMMPLTATQGITEKTFLSITEVMGMIGQREEMIPQPSDYLGWGPAKYYRLKHTGALVGFIGPMTTPHFCQTCNKMRLTADGKVRPCLGEPIELDLRASLRHGCSDDALNALLLEALHRKPLEHRLSNRYRPCRPMTAIGG